MYAGSLYGIPIDSLAKTLRAMQKTHISLTPFKKTVAPQFLDLINFTQQCTDDNFPAITDCGHDSIPLTDNILQKAKKEMSMSLRRSIRPSKPKTGKHEPEVFSEPGWNDSSVLPPANATLRLQQASNLLSAS